MTDALVDPDGTSHVRVDRSYRGIPVLGGDLVVHQGPRGAWKGTSQTIRTAPTMSVTPAVGQDAAKRTALAPSKANRGIKGQTVETAPGLVVDARGGQPRLAWEVVSDGTQADGTPSRLATYVDARSGTVSARSSRSRRSTGRASRCTAGPCPCS